MLDNYNACEYCNLILHHISILQNELTKSKQATLLELKSYYWLIKEYYSEVLFQCDCEYKNRFRGILTELLELFQINEMNLDVDKRQCDMCRILPCELFSLLDLACKISNQQEMESMCAELHYHIFLTRIYDELIGRCTECDTCVEYIACLENTYKFLANKDLQELREFVYFWKIARNNDEIWGCSDAFKMDDYMESTEINVDNHTTIYLDFNVYNRYEKETKVAEFFKCLMNQERIDIVYSSTHLEEVLRMDNEEYEVKRINSIQILTHGKIAVVGANGKIVVCVEDIAARLRYVKRYQKMDGLAEERECIKAEAREHLSLHVHNEQRDKAIGASSIQKIIENVKDSSGRKKDPNLPDEEEVNMILRYVGIGGHSIREYSDMFMGDEKEFKQINAAIVSIAGLLNVLGLHGDKIAKKSDFHAVYPIYHKKSYRTIRSGYYDNNHLSFASKCTYFVTADATLYEKAKEIYEFLGIDTIPIMLDEFMSMSLETLS